MEYATIAAKHSKYEKRAKISRKRAKEGKFARYNLENAYQWYTLLSIIPESKKRGEHWEKRAPRKKRAKGGDSVCD